MERGGVLVGHMEQVQHWLLLVAPFWPEAGIINAAEICCKCFTRFLATEIYLIAIDSYLGPSPTAPLFLLINSNEPVIVQERCCTNGMSNKTNYKNHAIIRMQGSQNS